MKVGDCDVLSHCQFRYTEDFVLRSTVLPSNPSDLSLCTMGGPAYHENLTSKRVDNYSVRDLRTTKRPC